MRPADNVPSCRRKLPPFETPPRSRYNPTMLHRVCIFCGSNVGVDPDHVEAARTIGKLLSQSGIELIYGGGNVGLMGAVANACLQHGGRVTGVIPQALADKELAHQGLTRLHIVRSMHERKALMAELSDAFIALPGGFGTWEELIEVLTWAQLGIHGKPCALLNVNGYYDPLLAMADRAVAEGFVRGVHRGLLISDTNPARLLERLGSHSPAPPTEKVTRAAPEP
jgi:hypothetical protein